LASETRAAYADPGVVLFQRQGILFAQEFDASNASLTGEPVRVAEDVFVNSTTGRAGFAVSRTGTLIYRNAGGAGLRRFVWFDRTGKQLGAVGEVGPYGTAFDLSPDGNQIAVSRYDPATNNNDIWLMDLARGGVITRFTFDPAGEGDVIWAPDGTRIVFSSNRKGNTDIFEKKASGIGEELPIVASAEDDRIQDWSKDGRYLVYLNPNGKAIRILPLFGDRKPFTFVESPYDKDKPHFSFDGKWLAYDSTESGTWQIYAASFPAADQKRLISTGGGVVPRWRRDGKELYYLAPDGKLMAVDIKPGEKLDSGIPHALFDTGLTAPAPAVDQYAVTPDGQRFLVQLPVDTEAPPITVIVNWTASLKK
jgi:WD40 repeat protein